MKRRDFLKGVLAVSGSSLFGLPKVALASPRTVSQSRPEEAPLIPWEYVELDPEYVRKLGHLGYYCFECSGGSFWAIIWALREKVGYPYTLVPIPSKEEVLQAVEEKKHIQVPMQFGFGGGVAWGNLCGALNGSAAAVTMVSEWEHAQDIIKRLFRWYETALLPSGTSNEYAVRHEFFVPKYKSDKALPQNESGSVLCHLSVAKWCVKSGYASGSKERSERCARVTGDVAARAVEFLNANMRGELDTIAIFKFSNATAECRTCHYKGENYEEGQFSRGMMACETCHKDIRPHIAEAELRTAFGVDVGTWAGAATIGTIAGIGSHLVVSNLKGKEEKDGEG